ncbi:hypothetical protein CB1_000200072 [Camelus ferus]|nr:hypothetical protein CB1_000200072 [Camelus ferus]
MPTSRPPGGLLTITPGPDPRGQLVQASGKQQSSCASTCPFRPRVEAQGSPAGSESCTERKHRHHSKGSKPWSRVAAAYLELRRSTTSPHHCDYHMTTTHQISFQSPPLGQSMFPVPIQSRKIAPITRPGYIECINQYRSDFQAPGWSQIFEPDPAKSCGQEINKYIQTRQDTALGLQPATHQQQKPRWLKQEMPILAAKFGGDTVTRASPAA